MTATLDQILNGLMTRYKQRVPDVQRVIDAMIQQNIIDSADDIENDHIAFRTIGVPHLGIKSLEKVFLHHGYKKRDPYDFTNKKLDAFWYSPPESKYPRIFMSELRVRDFDTKFQSIIEKYTNQVKDDPVDSLNLDDADQVDSFLHSPLWSMPTWEDFSALADQSEYASWTIYNRYYLNHFTVSVHNLAEKYNSIMQFNEFLEAIPVKLNDAGGKAKVSPDEHLIQSSTVAELVEADFPHEDGSREKHMISGSYVEFAERKILKEYEDMPEDQIQRHHRREGFASSNADKIFESTYNEQQKKA